VADTGVGLQDSSDLGAGQVRLYPLTRIMGRAEIEVLFSGEREVGGARLRAVDYRGFEQMVPGMPAFRTPSMLSRVCGACGPFHQLASCVAIEDGCGTDVPKAARWFRELLAWLWLGVSHLVNVTYLALPDYALPMSDPAVRNVVGIYAVEHETVTKLTNVLSAFSEALGMLAGLPVHPAVIVPGGVSYLPDWSACTKASVLLSGCEHDLREILRLVEMITKRNAQMIESAMPFEGHYMASTVAGHHSLIGEAVTAAPFHRGETREISARDFYSSITGKPVSWSYLVEAEVGDLGPLLVGPLARVNLGFDAQAPWAELERTRTTEIWGHPLDREFLFLMALTLEIINAWENASLLLEQRPKVMEPCLRPKLAESEGLAVVESPRGTLVHRVCMDADGSVTGYSMVSPLQFNSAMVNQHLTNCARKTVSGIEISEIAAQNLQFALRSFSPCIPCGTH
jgi:coenzyme F420-reducing hydrogenase alpha subunit